MGAALQGGRWNPKGVEVVYAAATVSLASLEVLVSVFSLAARLRSNRNPHTLGCRY